jgi:hypothetical protein
VEWKIKGKREMRTKKWGLVFKPNKPKRASAFNNTLLPLNDNI